MKTDYLEKLDNISDNPNSYTIDEKVHIITRVVKDIGYQVRGHYNDIGLLRDMISTIQKTIETLDNKLFGDRNSEGIIYSLTAEVNSMKKSFDNFTKVGWAVIGAVIVHMVLSFFNII